MMRALQDAERRFDFQATTKGLHYDLRLISTTKVEWDKWRDELLEMATSVIIEMYRANHRYARRSEIEIHSESEQVGNEMIFRYFSDAGKVEVFFDLHPKTLNISYKRVALTHYEEVFSLFA